MKRFFAIVATLLFAGMFIASTAHAGKTCSNKPVSAVMSEVYLAVNKDKPKAIVAVSLADEAGTPVCNTKISITTSRNMYAPKDGWPRNVDRIKSLSYKGNRSNENGQDVFVIETKQPAGTTVYVSAQGVKLGNPDGMPFMYTAPEK